MYRIDTSTPFQVTQKSPPGSPGAGPGWRGQGAGSGLSSRGCRCGPPVQGSGACAGSSPGPSSLPCGTDQFTGGSSGADGTLMTMSFGPSALQGFPVSGTGGRVEYRLSRNCVV